MNMTKLLLLAVCAPLCTSLAACTLLDVGDDDTSADDGADDNADEDSGAEDPNDEDSGGEDSGGEEASAGPTASDEESDGGADVESSGGHAMPVDPPSDVPDDLLGSWYTGNGETHLETIDLFTDGTYLEERRGEGPVDGCYTRYTLQLAGEYVGDDETLEMQATSSHLWVDSCGSISESDELPGVGVFDFQLGADEWGYTLRLTPEGGAWADSILYHRL